MKYFILILITALSVSFKIAGCESDGKKIITHQQNDTTINRMKIKIGNTVFTATLFNNTSANAFKKQLPLTVMMKELNGNEKFYFFPGSLPSKAGDIGDIKTGDLMLYGDNCLVLFYKSFTTSYSYTSIGKIDNADGLEKALGTGNVTIVFEFQ